MDGCIAANRRLFDENPAAALESAELQLDRDTMMEFETVLRGLARKLRLPLLDPAA